ncbi:P-loop containing nucleoside triphosphate hydrolase protein [Fusarium flagelliforme]|uniref:P-loop containing nucleoside triphosphate hydrolase protein n=1 Tax=Fusarium flagelliforme TaxID=2675880 RepID=UPI001E8D0D65|nr:P-loop containing nucleoside triphosphate hydrolase protein [Fusarium flagelliforme]KAH7185401.1 P-loop containing nucleoside triphosphate hydrolase protein [Fusarium flagelliforme]
MDLENEKKTLVEEPTTTTTQDDGEKQAKMGDLWRAFQFADRLDIFLNITSLICSIASGATMPLMTIIFGQFTGKFADFAGGSVDTDDFKSEVNSFLLWFIYLFVAKFILAYIATTSITISGIRTTRVLRQKFLEKLLRTEIWYFDTANVGSPAAQMTTNVTRINQGIAEKLSLLVQGLAMFVSAFVVAIAVQWKLALITLTVVPLFFFIMGIGMTIAAPIEARITGTHSKANVFAQEVLASIRTIHAFWAQDRMVNRYHQYLKEAHAHGKKKSILWGIMSSSTYFCMYSGNALAFWQGFRMYQNGEIDSVGTVFTVVLSALLASSSIGLLYPQIPALTNGAAAASEMFKIFDKPSLLDPLSDEGTVPETCHGHLQAENLSFSYPSRPDAQVLKDISLDIPAGKTTAFVGASGSGKSTIIGLLQRWYMPDSGRLLLDGMDVSTLNVRWFRSQMSLVQQEPVLFRGTVFENVSRGFTDAQKALSMEEQRKLVQEACEASYAHEFIKNLESGYDTYLGERGGSLSGGQKQRVAIARSVVSNPKILLLDEATSALDPTAERIVQKALSNVSQERTTLVIAHRLSTIKNADNIVVISAGQVVEQGTHDELLALDAHYARLIRAQNLTVVDHDNKKEVVSKESPDAFDTDDTLERTMTVQSQKSMALDKAKPKNRSILLSILLIVKEQKALLPLIVVSALGCALAAATWPGQAILFSRIITAFSIEPSASDANFYALMFFVIALGNLLAYGIIGYISSHVGQAISYRYRLELFTRMVGLDIEFFDRTENSSNALASILSSIPDHLQELLGLNIFVIVVMLANITASSILALAYGWKLALVMIFAGLPLLMGSGYFKVRLESRLHDSNEARFRESASLASEAVSALRTVASLTAENDFIDQYSETLSSIVAKSVKSLSISMTAYAFSQSIEFLVMALGFWYGSQLMTSGEYTAEQFFLIFLGILFAGQSAAQLFANLGSLTMAQGAANYLFNLREETRVIRETDENENSGPDFDQAISVDDVHFKYKNRSTKVLQGLNMDISPSQFVAVVGPSGCGKSTLISLLERYYDPTRGKLCVGQQDIKNISPRLFRSQMSIVQQEPVLYEGTVRENILMGLEDEVTDSIDERLNEAARQANVLDFVTSLPEGFNTPCGARGAAFSGGQRQRIAIARALIRKPKLLLLDEATSALDTHSEKLVQEALEQTRKESGCSVIAVAHRLSTIRDADIIFVVVGGQVAEAGSHEELQARGGMYADMCKAQSLNREAGDS